MRDETKTIVFIKKLKRKKIPLVDEKGSNLYYITKKTLRTMVKAL